MSQRAQPVGAWTRAPEHEHHETFVLARALLRFSFSSFWEGFSFHKSLESLLFWGLSLTIQMLLCNLQHRAGDEETKEKKPPTRGESGPAFDEELDDLAYLKVKARYERLIPSSQERNQTSCSFRSGWGAF